MPDKEHTDHGKISSDKELAGREKILSDIEPTDRDKISSDKELTDRDKISSDKELTDRDKISSDKELTDHDKILSETDRVIDPLSHTSKPNSSHDENEEKNKKETSKNKIHSSDSKISEYEEDETIKDYSEEEPSRGSFKRLSKAFDSVDVDTKRSIAHGMMDTALISANANQLKFVIQFYEGAMLYSLAFLIVLSLLIQVLVGIALIFRHRKKKKGHKDNEDDNQTITVDEITILGVFFVIIINIFISSFSGSSVPPSNISLQNQTT